MWVKKFKEKRLGFIEVKYHHPEREKRLAEREQRIISILHTPPNSYDINRSSWNYEAIAKVYGKLFEKSISKKTVERALKQSGYSWRHGRKVLTSPDPAYKEKIGKLLDTLRELKPDEALFFIDEAGPYRIKKYGGKALTAAGETRTIEVKQRSKGKVQLIAAVEAMTNQVSWRFVNSKDSASVVTFIEKLLQDYSLCPNIFLTWDATAFHNSHSLLAWINQHNKQAQQQSKPLVEVVPLPSRAQFLNVIEAIFSGMKKAVIKNSDYPSANAMKEAIDAYFIERNRFFLMNPKRVGNKIWDKEKFDIEGLPGGLFRRM
jgi:transposase